MDKLINESFAYCVQLLRDWAAKLGMTYEAINIYIFCIIEPIIFIVMVIYIIKQNRTINKFKKLNY